MVKNKTFFLLLLFFFAVFGVFAQNGSDRPERTRRPSISETQGRISFSILNETGFAVRSIFIKKADNNEWGESILPHLLYNRENFTVSLENFESDILYDVRVQDIDGDFYTKYNIRLRERSTVRMEISDFEWEN